MKPIGYCPEGHMEDYARRKGVPVAEAERWLAPNLGY
jgi:5-methyltetrahydrofolate--homocysteine methyltransferase